MPRERELADAAELVNREDARMRQRRDRPRFAVEPAAHVGIRGQMLRKDLDGHVALEP
jgi:hypothetical protein